MTDLLDLVDKYETILEQSFLTAVEQSRENYPIDETQIAPESNLTISGIEAFETQLSGGFQEELSALHDQSIILLLTTLGLRNFSYPEQIKIDFIKSEIQQLTAENIKAIQLAASNSKTLKHAFGLSANQIKNLNAYRQALENIQSQSIFTSRLVVNGKTKRRSSVTIPTSTIRNLSASQRSVLRKSVEQGLNPETIDRLVETQYKVLLKHRAKAIARNFSSKVAHTAQYSAINFTAKAGLIKANDYRRFWITAHDEKVRHSHNQTEAMNSKGVPINEPFQTPLGPVTNPPLEINCRCHVVIRKVPHGRPNF